MNTREQNLVGALQALLEQVYQMRGMFPDSDGAIARAVEDAEAALGDDEDAERNCAHEWVETDPDEDPEQAHHGEGRMYCSKCGADGDA